MILLVNGAFGAGKTTVARVLVRRLPRAVLFDPELIGIALQRLLRLTGRKVGDFQDLASWRRLTVLALRLTRWLYPNVVVPMAFSNLAYLDEIRDGIRRFEPSLHHVCLLAPFEVVRARIKQRRAADEAWQLRRSAECCAVHPDARFARHLDANRTVDEIAAEILRSVV